MSQAHLGYGVVGGLSDGPAQWGNRSRLAAEGRFRYLTRAHIKGLATHQEADNEAKESQNGTEDLDDKDLDEPIVCQRLVTASDATRHAGKIQSAGKLTG